MFGLPKKVEFCSKCTLSNQRPVPVAEFPKKYFEEILDYLDLSEKQFWSTINKFRSSHLWTKKNSNWKLKKTIYD